MKQFSKEEQARFWNANEDAFKGDEIARVVLSLARPYLGQEAIDVGAGSGALRNRFVERYGAGRRFVATDLVPRGPGVEQGDCTKLQFADGSFDTYFATDVIEHLSDADLLASIREANRVLRVGGHAIVTTLNKEKLADATTSCPECGCRFHSWGHCQVFDAERVKQLYDRHGFSIVDLRELHLGYLATHPTLYGLLFAWKLDRLIGAEILSRDLFFVARKQRSLPTSAATA